MAVREAARGFDGFAQPVLPLPLRFLGEQARELQRLAAGPAEGDQPLSRHRQGPDGQEDQGEDHGHPDGAHLRQAEGREELGFIHEGLPFTDR